MSKSKQKGTAFEVQVADYLSCVLGDDRIERRTLGGANDRGDIAGCSIRGGRVVIECKNCKRSELAKWMDEAEMERGNDGAEFAFVVHKRKGCGAANMGRTYATTDLETLAALMVGRRDLLCEVSA